MIEKVLITLSHPAFSYLLHENVKSEFDQEGFLLGEIQEREVCTTTDSEQVYKQERTVRISSVIPCPHVGYFYDGVGRIHGKIIQELLADKVSKVVAWYKFKHQPRFQLSFREKIVHKELAKFFSIPADLFTMCHLTTDVNSRHSTHCNVQTFLRYKNGVYEALPMQIINLSDSNNILKHVPSAAKTIVSKIVKSLKIDTNQTKGFGIAEAIHTELETYISQLPKISASSEREMYELECEVVQLKKIVMSALEAKHVKLQHNPASSSGENGLTEPRSPENTSDATMNEDFAAERKTKEREKSPKQTPDRKQATISRNVYHQAEKDEPEDSSSYISPSFKHKNYAQATRTGK